MTASATLKYLPQPERYIQGTIINSGINTTDTQVDLDSPPTKLPTYIEFEPDDASNRETVRVINVSGNTCTIERGVYTGGTGKAHSINKPYKEKVSQKHFDALVNAIESGYITEDPAYSYAKVNSTSFTITGSDRTAYYTENRVVRFNGSSTNIGIIDSSSYSNPDTTVVLKTGTIPSSITSVEIAIAPIGGTDLYKMLLASESDDGWISVAETWTYASANTLTISGDYSGVYQKGDKIKLTNSSTKYFYILDVSYSSPNTTITLIGGDDYALANTTISNVYYSRVEQPFGFPSLFTFTPAFSGSGGSVGVYAQDNALGKFRIVGNLCFFFVSVRITNKGSWSGDVIMSYPVTASSALSVNNSSHPVFLTPTGSNIYTSSRGYAMHASTTTLQFITGPGGSYVQWSSVATNDWVTGEGYFAI